MKKLFAFIFVLIFSFFTFILLSNKDYTYPDTSDILSKQREVDMYINSLSNDSSLTIDNPKILNNPYYISPLTSLIIFSCNKKIDVQVLINDKPYKSVSGSSFIIPLVNLIEGKNNKIDLISENKTYTYYIKTEDISDDLIEVNKKNNFNILASSTKLKHFIMNEEGKLIWYLKIDSQGFIEKASPFTFLIGSEESVWNGNVSTFSGIYEIDYLGKIRKRFDTPYGYHHEIISIGNNHVLVLGTNKYPHDTIYELDILSGEVIKSIDIIKLLSENDFDLLNYLENLEYGLETNSIDYRNGNILISLRNINTIVEFSYDSLKINYLLTSNQILKNKLSKYIIDSNISLMGQHNAKYISDDVISFYNNGYDHLSKDEGISRALVLKVNKKASVLEEYKNENKYSYAFGSVSKIGNLTLVNYPYMYKKKKINKYDSSESYTNLILYDDKVIKANFKINDNVYRAKKFEIESVPDYYNIDSFKYYGSIEKVKKFGSKKSKEFKEEAILSNNSIELFMDTDNKDIEVYFVGKNTYKLKYLNTKTYFSLNPGVYQIYIKINDVYYKYKNILKFS